MVLSVVYCQYFLYYSFRKLTRVYHERRKYKSVITESFLNYLIKPIAISSLQKKPLRIASNFIEIKLMYRCSHVNLLHIFRIPYYKNNSRGLLQQITLLEQITRTNNITTKSVRTWLWLKGSAKFSGKCIVKFLLILYFHGTKNHQSIFLFLNSVTKM